MLNLLEKMSLLVFPEYRVKNILYKYPGIIREKCFLEKIWYRIYPKYSDTSTPYHICSKIWTSTIHYPMLCLKIAGWVANSVDPDKTPRSAVSHLGLYCLLRPVCPNIYGKYGNCHNIPYSNFSDICTDQVALNSNLIRVYLVCHFTKYFVKSTWKTVCGNKIMEYSIKILDI